ncbi:MAG TPA: hypothetical protein VNK23_10490 [Candidatus Dormibacteraeota bacterium]|nr:hypothetical protein [Candidatus Dormibacteraeota bacterium]
MNRATETRFDAVLRILEEQHRLCNQWPYSADQIQHDKELSAELRGLIDQLVPKEPAHSPFSTK